MTALRKCELICGIATGIAGIISFIIILGWESSRGLPPLSLAELTPGALVWLSPPLLLAYGSYGHAVKRRAWGKVVLWASGALLTLLFAYLFFGGIFYYGWSLGLAALAPGLLALLTVLISIVVNVRESSERLL